MLEIPHLTWTASHAQVNNGLIPLHVPRLSPEALRLVQEICPDRKEEVCTILSETLCRPHAQEIWLEQKLGSIASLLVVPMGEEHPKIFTFQAWRVHEVSQCVRAAGRSTLVPWPVIAVHPLARWSSEIAPGSKTVRRGQKWPWLLTNYALELSSAWSQCMLRLGRASIPERAIVELTARLGVRAMHQLAEAARLLVGTWARSTRILLTSIQFSTTLLIRRRNFDQARAAFPMIDDLLDSGVQLPPPSSQLLDLAIDRGEPLVEAVARLYSVSRPLIDTLRFRWPPCAHGREIRFVERWRRLGVLAPEALPRSAEAVRRLERLLDHPLSDISDAVLRTRAEGATALLRSLMQGNRLDELVQFSDFLFHAASECGVDQEGGRISLVEWLGRPTLAQWMRASRQWEHVQARACRITGVSRRLSGRRAVDVPSSWPVPFEHCLVLDGWSFRFLASEEELEREGIEMEHCAASQSLHCQVAAICICHVIAPDQSPATVSMKVSRERNGLRFDLQERVGINNSVPPKGTEAAAGKLAARMSSGSIQIGTGYSSWAKGLIGAARVSNDAALEARQFTLGPLIDAIARSGPIILDRYRGCLTLNGTEAHMGSARQSLFDFLRTSIVKSLGEENLAGDTQWRRLVG